MSIEVHGADRLARTLRSAEKDLKDLDSAASAAGRLIAGRGQQLAPRRSGALVSSISARGAVITASARYSAYVHNGARGHRPRPFLTDAAKATQPAWLALYEAAAARSLNQVKGA